MEAPNELEFLDNPNAPLVLETLLAMIEELQADVAELKRDLRIQTAMSDRVLSYLPRVTGELLRDEARRMHDNEHVGYSISEFEDKFRQVNKRFNHLGDVFRETAKAITDFGAS